MTRTAYPPQSCPKRARSSPVIHERDLRVLGKVIGGNFAEHLTGGVFGSEAFMRRVWYVTEAANLLRILTRIA